MEMIDYIKRMRNTVIIILFLCLDDMFLLNM